MTRLFHSVAMATTLSVAALSFAGCAQATPGEIERKKIEEVIKSYLLENPEIIRQALIELEEKQVREAEQNTRDAIVKYTDQILRDPRDVSIGPKDAKVQIVEFFDYNCGFCKRSTDWVEDTLAEYPDDVRFVFKELPVLTGPEGTSYTAARAALAADRQGKYREMHFAMMEERALSGERILAVAAEQGLDVDQLKKDMNDPKILRQIEDTKSLSRNIPALTGTPFFVINNEYVSGASMVQLDAKLEDALKS